MMAVKKCLGLQDPVNPLHDKLNVRDRDPTVVDWLNEVCPSGSQLLQSIVRLFPFLQWIEHYNLQWFIGDLIAGIHFCQTHPNPWLITRVDLGATIGAVVVPQGIGYAKLANLPLHYGLYTSFMGGVVYWLFATSKDITIGPVAVMSTVVGSIIVDVQTVYPDIPGSEIAVSIAVICGGIVTFMGLARLGFIIDFIPLPSITSFMTGSAITICAGQVKSLLGETADFSTRGSTYQVIIDSLRYLPSSQGYDAAMGVCALITLYAIRAACNYGARQLPRRAKLFFFIGALRTVFVILLFTMVSALVNLHRRHDPAFAIVGHIPQGFKHAGIPKLRAKVIKEFATKLPASVIVLLLEHIAVSKSFGRINNYTIDPSQELIAIGVTNLLGPFIGAYSATGSFSRSAIQSKSGVRTPLAGLITACVVLVAIYALTNVLYYVPHASLSGVIIHAVGDLIVAPNTIYQFWLISPLDAVIFAVGLVVAITNTIPNSIYVSVCISLLILLFRHAKAPGYFLARAWVGDGDRDDQRPVFLPLDKRDGDGTDVKLESPRPGVFVYRFSEGFNYPNAGHYLDPMVQEILKNTRRADSQGYVKGDRPWNDPGPGRKENEMDTSQLPLLRAIVLDFSAVNNVDVTSVQCLIDVRDQLNLRAAPVEVQWHFAHVSNRWTKRALTAAGFGYPSPLAMSVVQGRVPDSGTCSRGSPPDVEAGQKGATCKESDGHVKSWEKGLCSHTNQSVGLKSSTRPFFHVDLASALESVDVYLAGNPAA
ncbi:sulfate anion transporter [Penicillium capsulatum]|uniref:Sulfate anion transporter n=1 Tax=Penicillium capsulatum TaxID=69766 RepID=A0A9W9ITB5_9EURO|nr:sulfate anion transporter [Penicillium capsulatum]KAJ6129472.1 sulfate anion transporter [Penicillium capsulatum]